MGGLRDQFWTPDERPRGHGDPNSLVGKLLVLGYPLYFVFMVGAFAAGGGFTSMNDVCPGLVNSTVQQIWGVLLTVSTLLSPLNIFWQPGSEPSEPPRTSAKPPRQTLQDLRTSRTPEVLRVRGVLAGFWRGCDGFLRVWVVMEVLSSEPKVGGL